MLDQLKERWQFKAFEAIAFHPFFAGSGIAFWAVLILHIIGVL
jgi:hypothetical protein